MKQILALASAIVAVGCQSNPPPAVQPSVTSAVPSSAPHAPASPAASAPSAATPAAKTFSWDQNEVSLSGKFVKKAVEWSSGDVVPILVLDAPITVHATRDFAECKATDIWFAGKYAPELVGKRVTIKGHLQPAQTGHHHTCPWIDGGEVAAEK